MTLSASKAGQLIAEKFRREHRLGDNPIVDIDELERLVPDVDFVVIDLNDRMDGLVLRDPQTRKTVVGIGASSNPFRQRMTIAHEIGHFLAGDISTSAKQYICEGNSARETKANSFARHLLCPLEGVQVLLGDSFESPREKLSQVVKKFRVSPAVALIQIGDANLLSQDEIDPLAGVSAAELATQFGWRAEYDALAVGSRRKGASAPLIADATRAYIEGKIPLHAVAFARGQAVEDVREELESLFNEMNSSRKQISSGDSQTSEDDELATLIEFFGE
ncbi:ImmA/IrrE family metallo-endopeptidase [Arcanobacterium canis]|uniref:ImmA/IrrE family metallo-endopeptidase n=1 Tax=Arcanobacterium canis TaxID=999183 RepID=A0ABY8G0V2_9ACTO|nr:ImmA/IrrE family metallo-endopeptidase [Arcanobacterium canis]WFM83443.1 ImmA/IrrE family metallo-endopeptidase [Arcanobacterium canis]